MLLVLFRAIVAAGEREDQRVVALQLAEPAHGIGVVGQLVVGKDPARHDVGTHSRLLLQFLLSDLGISRVVLPWRGRARRSPWSTVITRAVGSAAGAVGVCSRTEALGARKELAVLG